MTKFDPRKIAMDLSAGRHATAFKKARVEAKKNPRQPEPYNMAGLALAESGDHRTAVQWFRRAAQLRPSEPEFRNNLILALIMSGGGTKASDLLEDAIANTPLDPKLHHLRAMLHYKAGAWTKVIAAANVALHATPSFVDVLNLRGIAKSEIGRTEEALEDFRSILAIDPRNVLAHQNCGERLSELGHHDLAAHHYFKILESSPHHGYALSRLADIAPEAEMAQICKAAREALDRRPKDFNDRVDLHMALGTALRRMDDMSAALREFDAAHQVDAQYRSYSAKQARLRFEQRTNSEIPIRTRNISEETKARPIFIVGLPRSGTTLVEMILTRAPGIASCGELPGGERLAHAFFEDEKTAAATRLERFARNYVAALPDLPPGSRAFIDKLPGNYARAGLLLSAFPEAVMLNVQRDPRDVAFSMWRQRFVSEHMNYASRLENIADEANLYKSYMALWSERFPERILSIRYEDLVADMPTVTRVVATFCGVEWSNEMLHPEANTSAVRTASRHQVRQSVHQRSIGGWNAFSDRVTRLTDRLDPTLWPQESTRSRSRR